MNRSSRCAACMVVAILVLATGCAGKSGPSAHVEPSATPAGASSATPKGSTIPLSSLSGRILFARAGGAYGDETVYVASADGSGAHRVTAPGRDCCARWSPDGRHIFLAAQMPQGRITTAIIAPGDPQHVHALPLPASPLNLACAAGGQSPTTGKFLCEGFSDPHRTLGGIYTVDASGRNPSRVTQCCGPQDDHAVGFSPDGHKVYVCRPLLGLPSYGDTLECALFVANVNGSHLRRLTPKNLPVEVVGSATARLSPDGRTLVFTSNGAIWTIGVDGGHPHKVFQDAQGRLAITPTWSPDGRYLLFGLDPPGELAFVDNPPANGLYVIRVDGSGLTPVLVTPDFKREPDWTAR